MEPLKAVRNIAKHGVDFSESTFVFSDPLALFLLDRKVTVEERWQVIGTVNGMKLLVVVHTVIEEIDLEVIRIISARAAERWERILYEEQNG